MPETPPGHLLVHTHLDDEATATGLTMARAVDTGARPVRPASSPAR